MLFGLTVGLLLTIYQQEPAPTLPGPREAEPHAQVSPRTQDGNRIKEPKKTKSVAPEWPENARRAGLNGSVILECVVGIDGRVESIKVIKGYHSLAEAAQNAVRKWRYTITEIDGKAVPVIMTVTVNFKLQEPPRQNDVLSSLGDSDPEIRWAALKWLGRYQPITAKQRTAIGRALQDSSELVRNAAKEALDKLDAQ